jgi:hypothetical protein
MTEAEWLTADDLRRMLASLTGRHVDRKLRLFAVACVRMAPGLFKEPQCLRAVAVSESFADGQATLEELTAAKRAAMDGISSLDAAHVASPVARDTVRDLPQSVASYLAWQQVPSYTLEDLHRDARREAERKVVNQQVALLRDIFGNPFRPAPALDPGWLAWNGGTVRKLAEGAYEDRVFDRLPVLADALEDAGCSDPDLLGHLRGPGPHVRGCWAMDLILGKE